MKVRNKCDFLAFVLSLATFVCLSLQQKTCNPYMYYMQQYNYKTSKTETVAKYNYDNLCAN